MQQAEVTAYLLRFLSPEVLVATAFGVLATWAALRGPSPRKQQRDVSVGFSILNLFEAPALHVSDFETRFKGEVTARVDAYRVVVMNTGHEVIDRSDFDLALSFKLEGADAIWDCEVGVCQPPVLTLDLRLDNSEKSITIAPLMLNPGEYASFSFIVSGRARLRYSGRIRGITRLGMLTTGVYDRFNHYFPWSVVAAGIFMATMPYFVEVTPPPGTTLREAPFWYLASFTVFGLAFSAAGLWLWHSWSVLRRVRYMGKGTEHLFLHAEDHRT